MIEPTGYTALDLIGFTDKGGYDPTANYVKNDIVTVGNTKWRCKIDDTTGVTPAENANWTIYLESATSLAGMDDTDITSPKNGDGLVHDGNDWKNIPIMTKEQWKKNGAYNLLPKELYASTQVSHGITWTINADGSVSTSNTTKDSTNEAFVLFSRTLGYTVPAGQYCFCGKPSASKYRMMLQCSRGGVLTNLADLDNNITRAIVTIQEGDALQIALTVKANETGGDTFYPMLTTDLSATNADFTTPAKTNRELTVELGTELYSHTVQSSETFRTVLNDLWNNCIASFTGDKSRLKLIWRRTSLGLDYQCPVKIKGGTYITFGIFGISSASESFYQQYQVMSSGSSFLTMTFNTNGTIASYDNSTNNANVGDKFIIAYQ